MPDRRSASSFAHSTWWSWIWFCSKPSREPARYNRQARAVPTPTSATASSQCASRLADQAARVLAVLAEILLVTHLEASGVHEGYEAPNTGQLAVGEHIAVDEPSPACGRFKIVRTRDAMVEQPSTRPQAVQK